MAVAACGRVGFDDTTPPGTNPPATTFGCGLRDLAVGGHLSCAVDGNGGLWCWGEGNTSPVQIPLPEPAVSVGTGHDFACAILQSGKLRCFGMNDYGQLGNGGTTPSDTPVAPIGDHAYVSVAMQRSGVCAVTSAGAIECWGDDDAGLDTVMHLQPSVVSVPGATFKRIYASQSSMCADTDDNRRFCWGYLVFGEGNTVGAPTEVATTGVTGFGRYAACLLDPAGDVTCVGDGGGGELGDGTLGKTNFTGTATILTGVAGLDGGSRVQCAVGEQGEVWCWGINRSGEVGTGDLTFRDAPARVTVPQAARVAVAYGHTCAETTDGVYCWGENNKGELGRATSGIDLVGGPIAGLPSSIAEVRIEESNGCARTTAGDVYCWGQGLAGLTGDPSQQSSATASKIALPFAAAEIAFGREFACAMSGTQVACWGANNNGGLGTGPSYTIAFTPVIVPLPNNPVSSLSGGEHDMCVVSGTTPYCWGTTDNGYSDPMPVAGVPSAIEITTALYDHKGEHQCVLDAGGFAWCWGSNAYGELGRSTTGTSDPVPAQITGGRAYTHIATHKGYDALTCAIPTTGAAEIDCWGHYNNANIPVTTIPLTAVPIALAGGGGTMCALFADGTRDCDGDGNAGQLGDGTENYAFTFEHFTSNASAIGFGDNNACFVESGTVRCAGESRHGALGGAPPGATPMRVNLSCN
jgi:alpha-tubulin suppressor-like RCC1 family protein